MNKLLSLYRRLEAWVEGDAPAAQAHSAPPPPPAPAQAGPAPLRTLARRFNAPHSRMGRLTFHLMSVMACVVFSLVMLYTVSELPLFGEPTNPTDNELSARYIEQGMEEVGAANLVTNMILVYRGFDTYGESCVLFLAATCVIMLLGTDQNNTTAKDLRIRAEDAQIEREERSVILQGVVRFIMPLAMMFGLYILFNGHLSPGGGFAGGSVLGGTLILCDNAFGAQQVQRFFNEKIYRFVKIGALVLYAALICYTIFAGANGLPSVFGPGTAGRILSAGITMPINVAVGLEVACTMYSFYAFFSKGEL